MIRLALASLAVALLAFEPVLSALHAASARHGRCAAHGEVVELGTARAERPAQDGAGREEPGGGALHHDHCAVAAGAPGGTAASAGDWRQHSPAAAAAARPASIDVAQIAPVRLAPKGSPPSA